MTKEDAEKILLKYAEDKNDVLAEAITTYFTPEEYEEYEEEFYNNLVDKCFVNALVEDGLDGDIIVTIDGTEYPLFIDYFHTDINKRVRTYYAHYYRYDSDRRIFPEYVYYTFTNKDMSNISR